MAYPITLPGNEGGMDLERVRSWSVIAPDDELFARFCPRGETCIKVIYDGGVTTGTETSRDAGGTTGSMVVEVGNAEILKGQAVEAFPGEWALFQEVCQAGAEHLLRRWAGGTPTGPEGYATG